MPNHLVSGFELVSLGIRLEWQFSNEGAAQQSRDFRVTVLEMFLRGTRIETFV